MENPVLLTANRARLNLSAGNDHPIVDLPFVAIIDGRQFRGRGLSLVAAYVAGLMDPAALNAVRIARLMFQFDGFGVTLDAEVDVREGADGSGEIELIFIRPAGPHLPQLRHILNSFIAGDLVSVGRAISVADNAEPKGPKAADVPQHRRLVGRVLGGLGVGLLSLALVGVSGTLVYQRMFVSLVPTLGTVVSTAEVLRATSTGQILFQDLSATRGEVAVAIQATSGDVQSLVMPCDCVIESVGLREGSTVLIGEPLLRLVSDSDKRLVSIDMPSAMLFDLARADRVKLTFPDGATAIANVQPDFTVGTGNPPSPILLRTDAGLAPDRMGQPVEVRIYRGSTNPGTWADAVRNRLVSLF